MRNNKGFSLVELIVVIAIMAVLAAVAVIGVSIYIPKAQEAADNQLLDVLTDALRSACLSEGVDQRDVLAEIKVNDDGSLDRDSTSGKVKITVVAAAGKAISNDQKTAIANVFNDVFKDDATFNQVKGEVVYFDGTKFDWKEKSGLPVTKVINGVTYTADANSLSKFESSLFAGIDTKELLSNVDGVVEWAGQKDIAVLSTPEFQKFYSDVLGGDWETATQTSKLNALVLYTAQASTTLDSEIMYNNLLNGTSSGATGVDNVAELATKYAVGMAYVRELNKKNNAQPGDPDYIDPNDVSAVMNVVKMQEMEYVGGVPTGNKKDTEFKAWYEQNGKNSIDGFLGALDIIDENTPNLDTSDIVNGGNFADSGYGAIVDEFLGKGQSN